LKAEYIDHLGNDLTVVNAARVSFDKESAEFTLRKDIEKGSDEGLVDYLAKHGHWCYDDKTQILTTEGWKYFTEITEASLVGQVEGWEHGEFKLSFVEPLQLHKSFFDGQMIVADGKNYNYSVTPHHRMLFKRRTKTGYLPWEIGTSDGTFGKEKRMRQTASVDLTNLDAKEYNEGMYLGFLLGDGYRSTGKKVHVRLKKERKISYLISILDALKKPYTSVVGKDGVTVFKIEDGSIELYDDEGDKSYCIKKIVECGWSFTKGVFDGLLNSDGSVKRNTHTFSSSSRALMDLFITLASFVGEHALENKSRHGEGSHKLNYRAMLQTRKDCIVNDSRDSSGECMSPYQGYVYCVTVPSGMVLVRRGGKQLVCGNTPFSHPQIQMRETVPIFVARQRFKHMVGFTYNEVSRRYVDDTPEFYIPDVWRSRPDGSLKQGSGDKHYDSGYWSKQYDELLDHAIALYEGMIQDGVAPEQARMVLPQSMYTSYYVTGSLAAWARAYKQRVDTHAQKEIQDLGYMWGEIIEPLFPETWKVLIK
jgi:thymidylate synthase (FAD)